jgi:hypothetical protein
MKPSVVVGARTGLPDVHHFHYGAQPLNQISLATICGRLI